MATPIPCDWEGCTSLADVLISDLEHGEGSGWCGPHYLDVCRQVVRAADDATTQAEVDATDAEALARLGVTDRESDPTASGPSSDAGDPPADDGGTPDEPQPDELQAGELATADA